MKKILLMLALVFFTGCQINCCKVCNENFCECTKDKKCFCPTKECVCLKKFNNRLAN